MHKIGMNDLIAGLEDSLEFDHGRVVIRDVDSLRKNAHTLAEVSALGMSRQLGREGPGMARYLTRLVAQELGIIPASIHDLYMARGQGMVPATFTVPAINLRILSFEAARAVFRAALELDASAFIFEIARSEMGYTDQKPAEYVTNVLAAAIAECYQGPVFIQGDHFQASARRYASEPDLEIQALRELIQESVAAGFFNIDIDTSTLVDLNKTSIADQQALNTCLSAMLTAYIRSLEPEGITISVGGEIGEVGGHNSTEEELRAYMDGYLKELEDQAPGEPGISKISIQTGTSHGGVVLPDGSIAKVSVDFDTLLHLSRVARQDYGLAGAVQHGASTLPEEAFGEFAKSEACEVHLATNFQNMAFDRFPEDLRAEMYAYLDDKWASERKEGMTAEQFYYKTRKNAIGPFKAKVWGLPAEKRGELRQAWQDQFLRLFRLLSLQGTRSLVEQTVHPVPTAPELKSYLGGTAGEKAPGDLAD